MSGVSSRSWRPSFLDLGVQLAAGVADFFCSKFCRKAGISQATYFNWKKTFDGLLPHETRRLKQLEDDEYFGAIVEGRKRVEYRQLTPFWRKRLEGRKYE